jgi:hypothetical protein
MSGIARNPLMDLATPKSLVAYSSNRLNENLKLFGLKSKPFLASITISGGNA